MKTLSSRTKLLSVILLMCCVAGAFMISLSSRHGGTTVESKQPKRHTSPDSANLQATGTAAAAGELLEPQRTHVIVATGRTLHRWFQTPVRASVSCASIQTVANQESGTFHLALALDSEIKRTITIVATGFHTVVKKTPDTDLPHDLGTILMEPSQDLEIMCQDVSGRPVPGAEIFLLNSRTVSRAIGTTDVRGRLDVPWAHEGYVTATNGSLCSSATYCDKRTESVRLTLRRGDGRTIGVRSPSMEGIPGLTLRITSLHRPGFTMQCTTGLDGVIEEPIPDGRYEVESLDPLVVLSALEPKVSRRPDQGVIVFADSHGSVSWIQGAQHDCVSLRLLSDKDLEPVRSAATWTYYYHRRLRNRVIRELTPLHSIRSGELRLPTSVLTGYRDDGYIEQLSILVASPSHSLISVPVDRLLGTSATEEVVLASLGLQTAWTISLSTEDKQPYVGPVLLLEQFPEEDFELTFFRGVASNGRVTGEGWRGGHVSVLIGDRQVVHTIAREALGTGGVFDISVPSGLLEVTDVPVNDPGDVVAVPQADSLGWVQGTRVAETRIAFCLTPGEYLLTPSSQRMSSVLESNYGTVERVSIGAGSVLQVPWKAEWSYCGGVSGRVEAIGIALQDILVAPLFGSLETPFSVDFIDAKPIEPDGSYVIDDLASRPRLILVLTVNEEGLGVPLAAFPPDDSIVRVECAELRLQGPSDALMVATYSPNMPGTRWIRDLRSSRGYGDVVFESMPCWVKELEVTLETDALKDTRRLVLNLVAGESRVIQIDP